jgi:hypothetical protein
VGKDDGREEETMKVSYYSPTQKLKLYEAEINEEELMTLVKNYLNASEVFIHRCKAEDLLVGLTKPEGFIKL